MRFAIRTVLSPFVVSFYCVVVYQCVYDLKVWMILSSVGRGSSSHEEMGCEVSEREDDLSSQSTPTSVSASKRFKVPMKFFYDCNGVGHGSVPRKLRSAMKKRNRESISPPLPGSKKMKHANDLKKPKLNVELEGSEWSPIRHKSGPITKDEEEVVETLFALAGMFPDKEATDKSKLVESVKAIPDAQGSLTPASKDELNSVCPSRKGGTDQSSIKGEELSERAVKMNSLNNTSVQGLSEFPDNKQYLLEAYSSVQTLPFSSKKEPSDEKTLCNPVHFGFASQLNLGRGLEHPRSLETSLPKRSPELVPGMVKLTSQANELEKHSIKEGKKNGLALWPGLSSTASEAAGSPGPILQSSTSKIPEWLDTSPPASSHPLLGASFSNDKVSERTAHKKLKRCAAHVYICHLTQALQTPERAEKALQPNHLKTSEGPKQENIQMLASRSYGIRGLNEVVSATNTGNCLPEKGLDAVRSVLQHKNIHQEQPHNADVSGAYSSHTQSLDFFSLSSGGGSVEANKGTQICHKGLEPMSQFHVPSLNPLIHHHSQLPSTMSQHRNSSHGYLDRLSSATQQLQLPHFLGTPFHSPHRTNPTNQQRQHLQHLQQAYQQQLQQQSLWAAQYRPAAKSMSTALLQNWQNGRQDPNIGIQPAHSQEVTGSKYIPISQQQQFMAISSPGRMRSHIRAAYEDTGGDLRAGGALPLQLQLLCHERL